VYAFQAVLAFTISAMPEISSGAVSRGAFWLQNYLDRPEAFRPASNP
jgi:hypothetical protein